MLRDGVGKEAGGVEEDVGGGGGGWWSSGELRDHNRFKWQYTILVVHEDPPNSTKLLYDSDLL